MRMWKRAAVLAFAGAGMAAPAFAADGDGLQSFEKPPATAVERNAAVEGPMAPRLRTPPMLRRDTGVTRSDQAFEMPPREASTPSDAIPDLSRPSDAVMPSGSPVMSGQASNVPPQPEAMQSGSTPVRTDKGGQ
jgi:hypothetical protein